MPMERMPMKRGWMAALAAGSLALGACTLDDLLGDGKGGSGSSLEGKVVRGLKTALQVGIDSSSSAASKVNGYLGHKVIKILLPEDAEAALDAAEEMGRVIKPFASELEGMRTLVSLTSGVEKSSFTSSLNTSGNLLEDIAGLESIGDSVIKYMNRAAEMAAPRSVPIFTKAITTLTIADGLTLLNSADSTAAKDYLAGETFEPLTGAYTPLVDSTLALVPLTRYWSDFRAAYNGALAGYRDLADFQAEWNDNAVVAVFPALQLDALEPLAYDPIATESLGEWTTRKSLDGLFYLVGEEEKEIRRDPFAYARDLSSDLSGLLREVFGEIMDMED